MFKVISPKGNLITIERAARVCEKRIGFNGEKRDLFEVAKNAAVPATAIVLKVVDNSTPNVFGSQEIYIGNLKSEEVEQIMKTLLSEGYFDFTKYDYQVAKEHKDIVLDGGESKPFCSEFTNSMLLSRMFTSDTEMFCRPEFGGFNPFNNMNGGIFCGGMDEGEFCEDTEGEDSEIFD